MKKQDLKNYKPKGGLEGFPKEIIARMLDCQEEQGNPRDMTVFEKQFDAVQCDKGFNWYDTKEGWEFWCKVIRERDFNLFFEKYPKKDNPQDFRVDDLENYIPKGGLECFPKEIIARMLDYQEEQGNPRDVTVFERNEYSALDQGGFDWDTTIEKGIFWSEIISANNFNLFFERYSKKENQDNSHKFRVGDKVFDILLQEVGVVQDITYSINVPYGLKVEFKSGVKSYIINGHYMPESKNPQLLHYRDDYNYDVIDFNNLPKRQEPERWRAEVREKYYYLNMYFGVNSFIEEYSNTDTRLYTSGNYFKTKEEAQEVADKLKERFKQLVKI